MLDNLFPLTELRGLATRRSKPVEYKSVRHALVDEEQANGWTVVQKNKTTTRMQRPKSHDKALEDRVWTLFYRLGFSHLSGLGGAPIHLGQSAPTAANQIDIAALDDEVCIAVECKSAARAKKLPDFAATLGKFTALRDNFVRAIRHQYPGDVKRAPLLVLWTANIIVSDLDRERAKAGNVSLLDESDLEYYEALVNQIGKAARYQFLADTFGGRQIQGLEIKVPAIKTKLGSGIAYTFTVAPEYLLKIAFVSHRARGKASDINAYQRMLKKGRLRSIRQYISEGGIFPTNIVVNIANQKWLTFDRGKQEADGKDATFGWLTIRPAYRVAWIIDGQHRLFAYAGHPSSGKTAIAVLAFVGLPASEQARLFVDINAEQRKVKQSLLQELYAELHWDADDPQVRAQAILSKTIQALDETLGSPFHQRILKADDARTATRCISLTSIFRAFERAQLFIAKTKKGQVQRYGAFWNVTNEATLKRTITAVTGYFDAVREAAPALWNAGSGEGGGLAMNDGVTVCVNVMRSVLHHLGETKGMDLGELADHELAEVLEPYGRIVGEHFAAMSHEQFAQFRALRGVQGQTAGTRHLEKALRARDPSFDPPGLQEFLDREKAQTTTKAFEAIRRIEQILQSNVIGELKREFGTEEQGWWFSAVPVSVRKQVDNRINEEGGKKGGREDNFDLIDYRDIIVKNWSLFEGTLSRGKGSKDARTKWIVEVNELRKPVMHASKGQTLPITEEQLAVLEEILEWLEGLEDDQLDSE